MALVLSWTNSGCPRVQGDEEEEDVDDLDNEFNYKQDNGKGPEWQLGQGEDVDLSSSSRHEPHHRIPRLTSGHQVILLSLFYLALSKADNFFYTNCFVNTLILFSDLWRDP
jgi:hypothetical protein